MAEIAALPTTPRRFLHSTHTMTFHIVFPKPQLMAGGNSTPKGRREKCTHTHLIGFPSLLLTPPCYHVSFLHVYSNSAGSSRTHAVHRLTLFSLFKIAFLITFQLFISSLHTRTLAATATRQAACTLSRLRTRSGASRYASSSDPLTLPAQSAYGRATHGSEMGICFIFDRFAPAKH